MPNFKNLLKGKKNIIGILILVVIAVSGFFLYKNNNSINKKISASTNVSENNQKKDENKKIEIVNKKDDKNTKDKDKDKKDIKDVKKVEKKENKPNVVVNNTKVKEVSNNKGSNVTVYMRVEGYDKTLIPRQKITVGLFDLNSYLGKATGTSAKPSSGWNVDKFKTPSNAHAIVTALKNYGFNPGKQNQAGVYDLQDYGWSLYMSMLNGNREFDYRSTSGWLYRVNDITPEVGCNAKEINDGDDIVWYFGAYGFDTEYSKISSNTTNIKAGNSVTITLKNEKGNALNGANIYANGKQYGVTNPNGNATIKFSGTGKYIISAERFKKDRNGKMIRDMVRPVPITVQVN